MDRCQEFHRWARVAQLGRGTRQRAGFEPSSRPFPQFPADEVKIANYALRIVLWMQMLKLTAGRLVFAFLCGAGFTALASLMLNAPYLALLGALFLTPGGVIVGALLGDADSPLLVLLANALIYWMIALAVGLYLGEHPNWRRAIAWLAVPVGVLVGLACTPRLDPLWPNGMTQLARRETQLQEAIPLGIDLERARGVLHAQKIEFTEGIEEAPRVVLKAPDATITAAAGDHEVFGEIQTDAVRFPCGYKITVLLLFGNDGKLKQRYIHRFAICP